jgi:hypothetical protein
MISRCCRFTPHPVFPYRLANNARRHCERSEAIHASAGGEMDCFASLAMMDK